MSFTVKMQVALAILALSFAGTAGAQTDIPDSHIPQADAAVYTLARVGNTVYVGGIFTSLGGVSRNGLAAFDAATGTVDPDWNPDITDSAGPGFASVRALMVVGDRIYVGGAFDTVNGSVTRNNLAAFELAGGGNTGVVDPAWDPNIAAIVGAPPVNALATVGTRVLAGGFFTDVNGGTTRNGVASFPLADGSTAAVADSWDPDVLGLVMDIEIDGNTVYVAGSFGTVNGSVSRGALAAFDATTGTVDPAWNPDLSGGFPTIIGAIELNGPRVYAGGTFTTVNGSVSQNWLAAFELANGVNTGAVDTSWIPGLSPDTQSIGDLAVLNSRLFVGGFMPGEATPTNPSALISVSLADGSTPATIDPTWDAEITGNIGITPHFYPIVDALLPFGDGFFVGGNYLQMHGQPQACLAGFDITAFPTAVRGALRYE